MVIRKFVIKEVAEKYSHEHHFEILASMFLPRFQVMAKDISKIISTGQRVESAL